MSKPQDVKLPFLKYIEDHKEDLQPPVCNKMVHNDGKLRVMVVGGPNQRKDYHLNLGEELFYQIKGTMNVKTMQEGKPKDVFIKEGEIFMLPGEIAHSPQRFENTIGLVIERARPEEELDGLRYFVDDSNANVLWQRFFHVTDLGTQLKPLIASYFSSEESKTRVPAKDMPESAWTPDSTTVVPDPYPLESKFPSVEKGGSVVLFENKDEFTLHLVGGGATPHGLPLPVQNECWLWVMHGEGVVNENIPMQSTDSFLAFNGIHKLELSEGAKALLIYTGHKC